MLCDDPINYCMLPSRNSCGYTPLDMAADKSHAEVISVLIKAGANVEKVDKFGVSVWLVIVYHIE